MGISVWTPIRMKSLKLLNYGGNLIHQLIN